MTALHVSRCVVKHSSIVELVSECTSCRGGTTAEAIENPILSNCVWLLQDNELDCTNACRGLPRPANRLTKTYSYGVTPGVTFFVDKKIEIINKNSRATVIPSLTQFFQNTFSMVRIRPLIINIMHHVGARRLASDPFGRAHKHLITLTTK